MAFISNLKVNKYRETPTPKKAMGKTRSDDVFVDIHRVAQIVSKIPKLTEDFPGFNPMEKVNDTQVIKMHNKFSRVCVAVVFSYTQTEDVVYFSDTQKIFRKKVLEKIDFFVQSGGYKIIP